MNVVYLDNNATTQVAPEVLEAMLPYFSDYYGNPSSMHTFGGQVAGVKIREARERVARLIGAAIRARSSSPVAARRATARRSAAALESYPAKRTLITTRVEHPAVLTCCRDLGEEGYRVTVVPVDGKVGRSTSTSWSTSSTTTPPSSASCGPTTRPA